MDVQVRDEVDEASHHAVVALLARAEAASGHPPLPDPQHDAVLAGDKGLRVLLADVDGVLGACGVLSRAPDGSWALHLVLDPGLRGEPIADSLGDHLVTAALALDLRPLRLWAMRASEQDDALAARHGGTPERALVQMRVPLPLPADVVAAVPPLATRPFEVGRDEEEWLRINNRAFAGHPEQGNWTADDLHRRLHAEWVDLNGFLVADAEDGSGLIGSCWTKIHRTREPMMGEIYIISVDPDRHGHGWGKALTVAGLAWLAGQGITLGMLYTDDDNVAAVALYRSLGFHIDHTDRAYLFADPA